MLKKITAQERQPKSEDEVVLPPIPAKRYFTIGEVSELCGVKPHVLRYWEQEFAQLRQVKRRGNRRYYQHHEVLLVRRIRELLYAKGYTIHGARNVLTGKVDDNDLPSPSSALSQELSPLKSAALISTPAVAAPTISSAHKAPKTIDVPTLSKNISQTIAQNVESLFIKQIRKDLKNLLNFLQEARK